MDKITSRFLRDLLITGLPSSGVWAIYAAINHERKISVIVGVIFWGLFIGLSFAFFNNAKDILKNLANLQNVHASKASALKSNSFFVLLYKSTLNASESLKHLLHPPLIFLGVACLHFLITYMFVLYHFPNFYRSSLFRIFATIVLLAPGYIPVFVLKDIFRISFSHPDTVLYTLAALGSSFLYGIMGGFLVSRKRGLQLTGIIVACLFILLGCLLTFMIVMIPT